MVLQALGWILLAILIYISFALFAPSHALTHIPLALTHIPLALFATGLLGGVTQVCARASAGFSRFHVGQILFCRENVWMGLVNVIQDFLVLIAESRHVSRHV